MKTAPASPLFHYTCEHSADRLGDVGELLPARELASPAKKPRMPWSADLVWLTDLTRPVPDALGLTMLLVTCDRTAYRYRVTDVEGCAWWPNVRLLFPGPWRDELERAPGVRLRHWWVAAGPVPVERDPL